MIFNNIGQLSSYLLSKNLAQRLKFKEVLHSHLNPVYQIDFVKGVNKDFSYLRINKVSSGLLQSSFLAKSQPIGAIDLVVNHKAKYVNIPYIMINDKKFGELHSELYGDPMNDQDSMIIRELVLAYAENYTRESNCDILKRYIHKNLGEYPNFKKYGFELTGNTDNSNPFFVEIAKQVNKN